MTWRGLEDFGVFRGCGGLGVSRCQKSIKRDKAKLIAKGGGVIRILQSLKGGEIK